jgi:hypothetical protein
LLITTQARHLGTNLRMLELQKEARFSAVCHRLHMNRSDPKSPDAVWQLHCRLRKHRAGGRERCVLNCPTAISSAVPLRNQCSRTNFEDVEAAFQQRGRNEDQRPDLRQLGA